MQTFGDRENENSSDKFFFNSIYVSDGNFKEKQLSS